MSAAPTSWPSQSIHREWLADETRRLVEFTKGAVDPRGGFGWLDVDGHPELDRPAENWITTRVTQVMAVGHLLGVPGCTALIDHGIAALRTVLRDDVNGGWFADVTGSNGGDASAKRAYETAFVVLCASSAVLARRPGADELLSEALDIVMTRFWDESRGVVTDVAVQDWSEREPYGGANANMHTVEALLAAADVTGERVWLDRALRIASFFIDRHARVRNWRIPEHFDVDWNEVADYNTDDRAHRFRPYGVTVGHGFEWSRLCLHLSASLGNDAPAWLVEASKGLFAAAVEDGWQGDGFLYTADWDGSPVVADRLHWVVCEAIAAAAALYRATGDQVYDDRYRDWWDLAETCFIDRARGSWHAQLDTQNRPSSTVWSGKPDTYHAFQATLIPRLPLTPSLASAVARGLLE